MRILSFFKNRLFLSLLGLTLLSLTIWFGGMYLSVGSPPKPLSSTIRLILIIIVILIWGLNNLRVQHKARQNNQRFVSELEASAKENDTVSSEESALLQARFNEALDTIKHQRFGEGGKKEGVYGLPWYIIIGPPGAGKTTILANSGLKFPLKDKFGLKGIGGVGGTRNCDWWFTDQAVLIDTAGRYTTQDSQQEVDRSAWAEFLNLLKKHRPRKAINGVVLAISVSELLLSSRAERSEHADTLRDRIHELRSALAIDFPIYLLFTKVDLIAGFNEFFEDLGLREREQVWGMSFPYDGNSATPATEVTHYFAGEFDALVERLNDRLIWRMQNERDISRLGKIQNFPIQFEQLKETLNQLITEVFSDNRYQYPALLRGVYFTSGTQQGTPIDRILSSLARDYHIDSATATGAGEHGKAFFIHNLLNDVIFREAGIIGLDKNVDSKMRLVRRAFAATLAIIGLGTISVWALSLHENKDLMGEVQRKIDDHKRQRDVLASLPERSGTNGGDTVLTPDQAENHQIQTVAKLIQPLDEARAVYTTNSASWLNTLGMYDSAIPLAAENAYVGSLRQDFLKELKQELEGELTADISDRELYEALKTYLMLGNIEHLNKNEVVSWFQQYWSTTLPGQAGAQQQLLGYLRDTLGLNPELDYQYRPIRLNAELVERARVKARQVPVAQRIYNQIRQQSNYSSTVNLSNEIGRDLAKVFDLSFAQQKRLIPVIFTKGSYDDLDLSKDSRIISKYARERWVLGEEEGNDYSETDIENIAEKVRELYLNDYVSIWNEAISSFRVKSFAGLDSARDVLASAGSEANSPIRKVLETATEQTQLTPIPKALLNKAEENELVADAKDAMLAKLRPPTTVDNAFRPLHQYVNGGESDSAIKRLSDLSNLLEGFALSPNQYAAAFDFAASRFTGGGNDPIRATLVAARQAPKPAQQWLKQLADQTWKTSVGSGKGHLNKLWREEVCREFSASLARHYPFDSSAKTEASLLDFAEFFKPDGIEERFVNKHLAPFLVRRGAWSQRAVGGRSMGISSDALAQLKRADTIRRVFFRRDASSAGLNFSLTPRQLDRSVRRFELRFAEQRLRYSHGPKLPVRMDWPPASAGDLTILFEDINGTRRDRSFSGDWSLFRMLDSARVQETRQPSLFFVTINVSGRKAQLELKAKSFLNPFQSSWLRRYRCPAKL